MTENVEEKKLTKEEIIVNYIKALDEIDQAMTPYREHRSALKKNYVDNHWLSKEEQSLILKAYRMLKDDQDLGAVQHYYDLLKKQVKV